MFVLSCEILIWHEYEYNENMLHKFAYEYRPLSKGKKEVLRYVFYFITAVLLTILYISIQSFNESNNHEKIPVVAIDSSLTGDKDSAKSSHTEVIGFLPSWNVAKKVSVPTEYLDQVIYFGLGITETGEIMKFNEEGEALIEWTYFNSDHFHEVRKNAKETNTQILISIKNFDNESIDTLISHPTYAKRAVENIRRFVLENSLDGVNIDFEYFTRSDFPTMKYYSTFLQSLTEAIKNDNPHATVSVDVNATVVYRDNAYDIVKIGEVVDQLIVMGYDFHVTGSSQAGPVAPLDAPVGSPSLTTTMNSLKGRIDPQKVVIALPLYGYEWQTYTKDFGSRTVPHTGALATYKRVRELKEARKDISLHYDQLSESPRIVYTQNGLIKQIYYEDENSLRKKYEYFASQEVGGIGFFALGYEGTYTEPWLLMKDIRASK